MQQQVSLFDRQSIARSRARARRGTPALFLHQEALVEVSERLELVNKTFKAPAVVTGWPEFWGDAFPNAAVVGDEDTLSLNAGAHDLVIHAMSLHCANDPVGQLIQSRRALQPDGLFMAVLLGGQTLSELRVVLAEAETEITGGLSPRVAPMAEIRELGGLLQRAGLALPVADSVTLPATYSDALALIRDLRAMGESNPLSTRRRQFTRRAIFDRMSQKYAEHFPAGDNRIAATFELIFLSGWAPDSSQPKPLRPGSAVSRLADALKTEETKLDTGD